MGKASQNTLYINKKLYIINIIDYSLQFNVLAIAIALPPKMFQLINIKYT